VLSLDLLAKVGESGERTRAKRRGWLGGKENEGNGKEGRHAGVTRKFFGHTYAIVLPPTRRVLCTNYISL